MKFFMTVFFVLVSGLCAAQKGTDSGFNYQGKIVTLSEVVVKAGLNVPKIIGQIKEDTSFYKAFRNLRILGFTAINDVRMLRRNGESKATLASRTRQIRSANCRRMEILEENTTGDFYDSKGSLNYYTAELYASLFFTKDSVCGEDNIVTGREFSTAGKSGMEKHKEQLKMLFFNPGRKIKGIPFISEKTDIFEPDMAEKYNMSMEKEDYNHTDCLVFKVQVKDEHRSGVVINEMTTWFNVKTMDVVARKYWLSYDAGFYDFDVQMEVLMSRFGELLVPSSIKYNGNWKAIFKKRERGVFTATLFDFK